MTEPNNWYRTKRQLEQMTVKELRSLYTAKGSPWKSEWRGLSRFSGTIVQCATRDQLVSWLSGDVPFYKGYEACSETGKPVQSTQQPTVAEAPPQPTVEKPKPTLVKPTASNNEVATQFIEMLEQMGQQPEVDVEAVEQLIRDKVSEAQTLLSANMANAISSAVSKVGLAREVILHQAERPPRNLGIQHEKFDLLLKTASCRDANDKYCNNIYLYGPAGTGKTTAASKLAEALGLKFYFNGAIDSEYKLSGFIDASGTFQSRPFFEAYTKGGVYLFDELDSSMPSAVLAFNAALANGHCDFPTGKFERHPDFICLGAGNTTLRGDGGTEFQRLEQDGALRDRFTIYIEWPLDDALEASFVPENLSHWLKAVRVARDAVKQHGIGKSAITPRCTKTGVELLLNQVPFDVVVDCCIRKGLEEQVFKPVRDAIEKSQA
jgi:hypothetical protein